MTEQPRQADAAGAVVTGGGRGLGRGISLALARAGFNLVIGWHSDREEVERTVKECEAAGVAALTVHGDVSERTTSDELCRTCAEAFGAVGVWVNNAGVSVLAPILETSTEAMKRMLNVNVLGVFHGTKVAARAMAETGAGGRIINVASDLGVQAAPLLAGYSATKFAVVGLSQAAALEFAPLGIAVNAVCPGTVETDMVIAEIAAESQLMSTSVDRTRERIVQSVPAGRLCTTEDVGALVAWLAQPQSSFITGQAICVNGGSVLH